LLTLDLHASLVARLDDGAADEAAAEEEAEGDAEQAAAGALTLAIDLTDGGDGNNEAPGAVPAAA
jgi:exoribonuclease II